MEESSRDHLPSIAAHTESISLKIREIAEGVRRVSFSHVTEAAQAFLVSALANEIPKTLWVLCPSVRSQESLYETLLNWHPNALFLPEAEIAAVENILPDPEIAAERLALLSRVQREKSPHIIVATRAALDQSAPAPAALHAAVLVLRRGKLHPLERTIESLVAAGYDRVSQVTTRGQFAVRGGIVDLFSWQAPRPIRIEYFGDDIESLREFDVDAQTSVRNLQSVEILLEAAEQTAARVRDYVASDHLRIEIEPEEGTRDADVLIGEGWLGEDKPEDFQGAFDSCDIGDFAVGDFMLVEAKRAQFAARLRDWRAAEFRIAIYFQTEGEIERFREIMGDTIAGIDLLEGTLPRGFVFPDGKLVVLSGAELFGRYTTHGRRRLQKAEQLSRNRAQIDFSELNEGDLVVHLEHGVGRFLQLARVPSPAGEMQEALVLEFANDARLYVPLEQAYLVSRYVGVGKKSPALSSLADAKWARAKKNAAASIFDYAGKMLAVQAERETQLGYTFGPDTKWQREFEHSFPFRETPDQLTAITATKTDMERPRSMDRLICGDVGFGKTEVAIRAAFKAVMEGKQVAVLAPTTVLAQQHFETFRQRMLEYPVRVEMLSRFRSQGEQRKVIKLLGEGGVDVVIGTHRLISGDVIFKDLGLVVIDEEQRFGVLHKEKFKELFKLVDVLTLSATPIPRTLYLSLVGVKDMSTIETPPLNRLPVETVVCGYDERIIRDAINRELDRQGQVYFLHNRVQSIEKMRDKIAELCPRARVEFGHGQMDADGLESVMARFVAGKIDVLVCTTIIESGLDIPNANTIVIDEEQRFGVLHKERFKEMFKLVDMLTLSATPIPRTLYLSLMGAKDMSTIETPPLNRIPTETLICPYDERIIRDAINRELARQGQVFFLHNRVQSIEKMRDRIAQLCPKARIVIGHGQMDEGELEDVMQTFVMGDADVLISTTIIESGLDIPNANTILIDRADRFGLADLYPLRGRVGRAQHKAYAYLLLPRDMMSGGEARKRINAIKQYSSLGAGFKIAMRDLEIRGAGNILGTAQSGHIVTIGF
ncbi:MAG: hypothetical protein QOD64_1310, partial [Verrucomicrobiota bacterium]